VYPTLLPLMRTPRLPVVDWTDAPADLNGLVRFAERRNLVSARVPPHLNWPVPFVGGFAFPLYVTSPEWSHSVGFHLKTWQFPNRSGYFLLSWPNCSQKWTTGLYPYPHFGFVPFCIMNIIFTIKPSRGCHSAAGAFLLYRPPPKPKSVVCRVSTDNCLVPSQTSYTNTSFLAQNKNTFLSPHTEPVATDMREVRACRCVGSDLLLWGSHFLMLSFLITRS